MNIRHSIWIAGFLISTIFTLPPAQVRTTVEQKENGTSTPHQFIQGQLGFLLADLSGTAEKPAAFTLPNDSINMYSLAALYPAFREKYIEKYSKLDKTPDEETILDALNKKLKDIHIVGVRDPNNIIVVGAYDDLLGKADNLSEDCTSLDECIFAVKLRNMSGPCTLKDDGAQTCIQRDAQDIYLPPAGIPIIINGEATND